MIFSDVFSQLLDRHLNDSQNALILGLSTNMHKNGGK